MRYGVRSFLRTAVAATVLLTACSESTLAPATTPLQPAESSAQLLDGLLSTVNSLLVSPVHRRTALANDVTWSFTAGPLGAKSSNATVGLTITVPPGALDQTTKITVTAIKGTAVAYAFEPHLEFDRPVVLTQDLTGIDSGVLGLGLLSSFKGAHFTGDRPDYTRDGLAVVSEVVGAVLNLLSKKVSFGVGHFSGWILASGYE
jgi:hypothetical protein